MFYSKADVSDYARLTGTLYHIIHQHFYTMSMPCCEYFTKCHEILYAMQGLYDEVEKRYKSILEDGDEKQTAKELKYAISNILEELNYQRGSFGKTKMEEIAHSMFILISSINFKFITTN